MNLRIVCNHVGLNTLQNIARRMDIKFSKEEITEFKNMVCDGCLAAKVTAKHHPAKQLKHIRNTVEYIL